MKNRGKGTYVYKNCIPGGGPWSGEYKLSVEEVNCFAPEEPGIYVICIHSKSRYRWVAESGKWRLKKFSSTLEAKHTELSEGGTRLTYIGKADNLRRRLLEHARGQTNDCIVRLIEKVPLTFKYLTRRNYPPNFSELNAFRKFCEETGLCPPCDGGSRECNQACQNLYEFYQELDLY